MMNFEGCRGEGPGQALLDAEKGLKLAPDWARLYLAST